MAVAEQSKLFGYLVIATGVALAFVSSVVPFYNSGYRLLGGVLLAGLLPFLVYGLVVVMLGTAWSMAAGLILLLVNLWLVITQRFMGGADYSDGVIYYVPIAMAVAQIPLVFFALRASWHK